MFATLHPKVSQGERIGLTTKYRCQFCRFINDGNDRKPFTSENLTDGIQITVTDGQPSDVAAVSGCGNCGSQNWSTQVPKGTITRPEDEPRKYGRLLSNKRFYTRF